jgi:fibronectin type 3 domain-containing protein
MQNIKSLSIYYLARFLLIMAMLMIIPAITSAREVTLTWEPNSEPDLSHYIVYWGTASGTYTQNSGNIGLVTEYKVDIPNDNIVYFFAVTAVDTAGLESDYSNEVHTLNLPPPIFIFKKKEEKND